MITSKQPYETIEQKISEYKRIINFYEKNSRGRFQTKSNLIEMSHEILTELSKNQTEKGRTKLFSLYNKIEKFI